MHILMLTWEYPPRIVGGISRVAYHLAQELNRKDHTVTVITCKDGDTAGYEEEGNIRIHRIDPHYVKPIHFINSVLQMNLAMLEKAVEISQKGEFFDIIHLHDWLVAFAGMSLAKIYPIRQVCTVHSTEYGRNGGLHNEIQAFISSVEEKMVLGMEHIIVNSMYMKNELHALFGCSMKRIHVIPNGIETGMFDRIPRDMEFRRKYAADNEKIVFFVGRLVNEKGVHVLMDAIPQVLSRMKNVRFVISGSGPERDTLQKRSLEMGITGKVSFTGFISEEELLKLYKCVDTAVFPSLYEPFGIVALEGMVARIPVIVSEAGGFNETVTHRVNGMKFATGRADLLAACIIELFTSPGLVADITKNAWNTIHERYQWRKIADQTYAVYVEAGNAQTMKN